MYKIQTEHQTIPSANSGSTTGMDNNINVKKSKKVGKDGGNVAWWVPGRCTERRLL